MPNIHSKLKFDEIDIKKFNTEEHKKLYINIFFDELNDNYWLEWDYLRRWIRKKTRFYKKFEDVDELVEYLDKVPHEIIGAFKTQDAFKRAPSFVQQQLVYALPDDNLLIQERKKMDGDRFGKSCGISERDEKITEEMNQRKGIPKETVNAFVAAAFRRTLVKREGDSTNNLYVEDSMLTNQCKRLNLPEKLAAHISLFVVDKGVAEEGKKHPMQRVITDARATNARLENVAHMELFSIECLLQRMSYVMNNNINGGEQVFAIQCDLRHWFHQIKLPKRFRQYFRIDLGEKGEPRFVYPACFPMGFHMSPAVAQAATWSILLADLDNEGAGEERERLQIDWTGPFEKYIQWLPLKDGGAVFVLIDNIFVVTKNEAAKIAWKRRIFKNSNELGATLKTLHPEKQQEIDKRFDEQVFKKKDVGNRNTITFSGIEFGRYGRRPKDMISEDEQLEDTSTSSWEGTYREVASIFGQILWNFRIRGERLLFKDDFMELYSEKGFPRNVDGWDDKVKIDGQGFKVLQDAYRSCIDGFKKREFVEYQKFRDQRSYALVVSDAALEREKATNMMGGMFISHKGVKNQQEYPYYFSMNHSEEQIALAELKAVVETVRKVIHSASGDRPDIFLIAVDSMAAKGMISRGYSRVRRARELLRELDELIDGRRCLVMYVKSEDNPADAPSRTTNKEEIWNKDQQEKWEKIRDTLEGHLKCARTMESRVVDVDKLKLPQRREKREEE